MCEITPHDTVRTMQYKNMLVSKRLIARLVAAWKAGNVQVQTASKDFDSWYGKRTAADGKLDFRDRTRNLYNLVRGVTRPFPGAFCFCEGKKVTVWSAHPFDGILDLSAYAPGEIVDEFDGRLIVRTVDGSLLIEEYEYDGTLLPGMVLGEESV